GRGGTWRIAGGGRARLLATLAVVPLLTACGALVPPRTPTAAPVSTAPIVFATASPAPVQTPFQAPIPPPPTQTAAPAIPTPAPPAPRPLYVPNTGTDGLTLRRTPATDGERIAVLPDGSAVTPTGQDQQVAGRQWRQVRDAQGREGWVAADF